VPTKNKLTPEQMKQLRDKRVNEIVQEEGINPKTLGLTPPEIVDLTRKPGGPAMYTKFPEASDKTPKYYKYVKEPIENARVPTSTGKNETLSPFNEKVLGPGSAIVDPDEVQTRPIGFDRYKQIPKKYKSIDDVITEVSRICTEIKKAKAIARAI
jgi:hypothetical protein